MSFLSRLCGPCAWGHQEPIKVWRGSTLSLECPRCCVNLGAVLTGQRFKVRKVKKPKKAKKRPSADVLRITQRKASA